MTLQESIEKLSSEVDGLKAILLMERSGIVVARAGKADFDSVAAELAELWKQTRGVETISASGDLRAVELVASEGRWAVVGLGDDYLLTICADAGTSAGARAPSVAEIVRRVREGLEGSGDAEVVLKGSAPFSGYESSLLESKRPDEPAPSPPPRPAAKEPEPQPRPQPRRRSPAVAFGILFAAVLVGGFAYLWPSKPADGEEKKILNALANAPELAMYRLGVQVEGQTVRVSGSLPDEKLKEKAGAVSAGAAPGFKVENRIAVVAPAQPPKPPEPPRPVEPARKPEPSRGPDPAVVEAEVKRLASMVNRVEGTAVSARWSPTELSITGCVPTEPDLARLKDSFAQIPGVPKIAFQVKKVADLPIGKRIYFNQASADVSAAETQATIASVKEFLVANPDIRLRIIGHADPMGKPETNYQLAIARSQAVQQAIQSRGIPAHRISAEATPYPPPDVDASTPFALSRCVRFQPTSGGGKS